MYQYRTDFSFWSTCKVMRFQLKRCVFSPQMQWLQWPILSSLSTPGTGIGNTIADYCSLGIRQTGHWGSGLWLSRWEAGLWCCKLLAAVCVTVWSILALSLALSLNGVITNVLKVAVGRWGCVSVCSHVVWGRASMRVCVSVLTCGMRVCVSVLTCGMR